MTFRDKLHSTFTPDYYYCDYDDLPEMIRAFIEQHCESLVDIDCSGYTVFNPTMFVRHDCSIEGERYQIEIALSDVNKLSEQEELENNIESYLDTEWNQGTISIRELI